MKRKPRTTSGRKLRLRPSDLTEPLVREATNAYIARQTTSRRWTSLDLFCGAGGITEGFRRAGFECLYANDIDCWAIQTFRANHPTTLADNRPIEEVDAR